MADSSTYCKAYLNELDYYINLMNTQNCSYSHCENSLWIWEYKHNCNAAQFQQLIDKIKYGYISIPFTPLVPLYGAHPAELALRGVYYGVYLELIMI